MTNTVAPLRASSFAMPRPTPFVPPATIATLPLRMSVFDSMASLYAGAGAMDWKNGTLSAFIVDTWGRDTLIALIRADGHILQVPGITEPEFLGQWMTYLRERFSNLIAGRWRAGERAQHADEDAGSARNGSRRQPFAEHDSA